VSVKLSLAMIVKNEERTLARVLQDAAPFCDELVVVDTGSTDATIQIAEAMGARVEHFTWVDDFSAARNASFDACTGDWILWLDADDRIVPAVQDRLASYKDSLLTDALDAVYLPYRYHFADDGDVCTWEFPRERLIRRGAGLRWSGPVHEVIEVPDAKRAQWVTDVWVEHRPLAEARALKGDRNLRILEHAVQTGDRSLRTLFYFGNELADNGRLEEAIAAWSEFIEGAARGWERYSALTGMANAQLRLGRADHCEATIHRAIREDPTRAEAYVIAGRLHYDAERWSAAIPYFLAATGCKQPLEGFVAVRDYRFVPWDYLSVCWHQLGDQPRALEALGKAIDGNPERARLIENAEWIVTKW
jgi:tetratricopeptide (TPR) repeat protein